jgi:hypothetical protein
MSTTLGKADGPKSGRSDRLPRQFFGAGMEARNMAKGVSKRIKGVKPVAASGAGASISPETPQARIARLQAESNAVCGQISSMQDAIKGKLPEPGTQARGKWDGQWDGLSKEYQRLAVELRNARQCPNPKDPAELLIFIEFRMEKLALTGPEANREQDWKVRFDPVVGRKYTILEAAFVVYTQAYEHAKAMIKATPSLPQLPPRKECFKDNLEAIAAFNALRDWCDGNGGAAGGKGSQQTTVTTPTDLITTAVAVKDYAIARHTVARNVGNGTFKDYRATDATKNATFMLSRSQVAAKYPKR